MVWPLLTPAEWRAADARLMRGPDPAAGPATRTRRLPARIATLLASLEFRLGGA